MTMDSHGNNLVNIAYIICLEMKDYVCGCGLHKVDLNSSAVY